MSNDIDSQIQDALVALATASREETRESQVIIFLKENQERCIELYKVDGTIAPLIGSS